MPFIAKKESGERIIPEQADREVEYECGLCGDVLTVREGQSVARHFWHSKKNGDAECRGESDEHRRMKSIAASKARKIWDVENIEFEKKIGQRRADVFVEFPDEEFTTLGDGLVIEVQYKNKGKDKEKVNDDFISQGYSVLWLNRRHFSDKNVDFDSGKWVVYFAESVPPEDDWSGYHDVVKWLWSEKDVSVEMGVNFPKFSREKIENWVFNRYLKGTYESDGKNLDQFVDWDCGWETIKSITGSNKRVQLSVSPDGDLVLSVNKGYRGSGGGIGMQLPKDCAEDMKEIAGIVKYIQTERGAGD